MSELSALPMRGNPYEDESFMGYVLRMSNRNGLASLYWLYKSLHRDRLNHFTIEDVPSIAVAFGANPLILEHCFVKEKRSGGECTISTYGHRVHRPYLLRHLRPQVCPECISNCGYARALWDFSIISVCPTHLCKLVDVCPHCGKRLQWNRPSLSGCNCGFSWSLIPSHQLLPDHPCVLLATVVAQLLSRAEAATVKYQDPLAELLTELKLDTLLRVIWAFGIKPSANDTVSTGKSRTVLRTPLAFALTERAFYRLSHCLFDRQNPSEIMRQVHMPALYSLARETTSGNDIQLIANLMYQLGKQSRQVRPVLGTSYQLALF